MNHEQREFYWVQGLERRETKLPYFKKIFSSYRRVCNEKDWEEMQDNVKWAREILGLD